MKGESIIDTTILVYSYDKDEREKRPICHNLIKSIFKGENYSYITNQILGELFSVLTSKVAKPISFEKGDKIINLIIKSDNWKKINYTYNTIPIAMEFSDKYKIHFWDALIAATMIENNIFTIYTENEADFKKIPGLKVINPITS